MTSGHFNTRALYSTAFVCLVHSVSSHKHALHSPVKIMQPNGVHQPAQTDFQPLYEVTPCSSLPANGYETPVFWDSSIRLGLQITYQSLWSLSFVPPPSKPLLVLMLLTDASASNLLIWAPAPCFVSIQMQPAGRGATTELLLQKKWKV